MLRIKLRPSPGQYYSETSLSPKENFRIFVRLNYPENMKQIKTENAPAAIGPYSQATLMHSFVFVSGQLPIDPATGQFPEGGVKEQTRQSLKNLFAILNEAGPCEVLKTTVLLADMEDFAAMNEVYAEFFREPYPARCAFAVKDLPKGALVEIECIAAVVA